MLRCSFSDRIRKSHPRSFPREPRTRPGRSFLLYKPSRLNHGAPSSLGTLLPRERAAAEFSIHPSIDSSLSPSDISYRLHLTGISHNDRRHTETYCYSPYPGNGLERTVEMVFAELQRRVTQTLRKKKSRKFKGAVVLSSKSESEGVPDVPPIPVHILKKQQEKEDGKPERRVKSNGKKEVMAHNKQKTVADSSKSTLIEKEQGRNEREGYHRKLSEHHERIASIGSTDYPVSPPISRKEAQRPKSMDLPQQLLDPRLSGKSAIRPISFDSSSIPPVPQIPTMFAATRDDPRITVPPVPQSPRCSATTEDTGYLVPSAQFESQDRRSGTCSSCLSEESKTTASSFSSISHGPTLKASSSQNEDAETLNIRCASNQTAVSAKSDATVHHDPSKRCSSSSSTEVESKFHEILNPFSDQNDIDISLGNFVNEKQQDLDHGEQQMPDSEEPQKLNNEEPQELKSQKQSELNNDEPDNLDDKEQSKTVAVRPSPALRPLLGSHGEGRSVAPSMAGSIRKPSVTIERHISSRRSSRSSDISRRIMESTNVELRERKISKAFLSYNASAQVLGLKALSPEQVPGM